MDFRSGDHFSERGCARRTARKSRRSAILGAFSSYAPAVISSLNKYHSCVLHSTYRSNNRGLGNHSWGVLPPNYDLSRLQDMSLKMSQDIQIGSLGADKFNLEIYKNPH